MYLYLGVKYGLDSRVKNSTWNVEVNPNPKVKSCVGCNLTFNLSATFIPYLNNKTPLSLDPKL